MTRGEAIQIANQVYGENTKWTGVQLQRLLMLAEKFAAAERESIMDEWWSCVQSDLENGVKSLNERATEKWHKEYPAIAGFAAAIDARGKHD